MCFLNPVLGGFFFKRHIRYKSLEVELIVGVMYLLTVFFFFFFEYTQCSSLSMGHCALCGEGFSSDCRYKFRRSARSSDLHDHRIYNIVRWEVTQVQYLHTRLLPCRRAQVSDFVFFIHEVLLFS